VIFWSPSCCNFLLCALLLCWG